MQLFSLSHVAEVRGASRLCDDMLTPNIAIKYSKSDGTTLPRLVLILYLNYRHTTVTGPNWLKNWLDLSMQVNGLFFFFKLIWAGLCLWKLINASMTLGTAWTQRPPPNLSSWSAAPVHSWRPFL